MFGLDDSIAGFSDGTALLVVVAVAILLGLRHASDPDHLAAVTTLLASKKERGRERRLARVHLGARPRHEPLRVRRADRPLQGVSAGGVQSGAETASVS